MFRLLIALAVAICVHADYRILNGKRVNIEDFPYQVAVLFGTDQIGGGAIVTPRHVLTACHLLAGRQNYVHKFKVRVGSTVHYMLGVIHTVKRFDFASSPLWEGLPKIDIAVLTLHDPITFNELAQPIALVPQGQEPKHGEMLTVTGWGDTEIGMEPAYLRKARVPCIDRSICRAVWKRKSNGLEDISNAQLCAGGGITSSFLGDSGGPLVNDHQQLVGIVSWGKNKKEELGFPNVFVNLADPDMQKFIHSRLNATD